MPGTTTGLVWSRVRYDWRRHATAVAAVAILMGSFLTFNAVAGGMREALAEEIRSEGHDTIHLAVGGFGFAPGNAPSINVATIAAWDGVENASPRSAKGTGLRGPSTPPGIVVGGLANLSRELVLVGIDAAAESELVTTGSPSPAGLVTTGVSFRGFAPRNYSLVAGAWIRGPGEAVATEGAAAAGYGLGTNFTVDGVDYRVVGLVGNFHPANLAPPGVLPVGHLIVDRAGQSWPPTSGAFIRLRSDFAAIQSVTERLIAAYPAQTGFLRAGLDELERQYYEEARTQEVLSAAARLVGVAGAATVFAMSLFLLLGERKAFGTMVSVGFSRLRLASYMGQKMVGLALLGAAAGGALGGLVVPAVDVPTVSFDAEPTVDRLAFGWAALETLAAALLGSLAAFLLTIRKDPVEALSAE